MNVFFSRKKNEHNMNIGEHGSNKQASTFVREFILVYFFNLCAIKLRMRIPWIEGIKKGFPFSRGRNERGGRGEIFIFIFI
jgi:hypothetical protein